jgi:hypothetical protein
MCNLNILCQVNDGSCKCYSNHAGIFKPIPVPLGGAQDCGLILSIFRMISQQNEMIKQISYDTKLTTEKINLLTESLGSKPSKQLEIASEDVTNSDQLMTILCGECTQLDYSLQLICDLPSPAYKERAFSMLLQVTDLNGIKSTLPNPVGFTVMIFTTESPPKLLKVNTSGDKIMRGTIEAEGTNTIFFRKIVIKEVSSHFRNCCFFLVVAPKNPCNVKPLIIPNFVIKARKISDGAPRKKNKLSEDSLEETEVI